MKKLKVDLMKEDQVKLDIENIKNFAGDNGNNLYSAKNTIENFVKLNKKKYK